MKILFTGPIAGFLAILMVVPAMSVKADIIKIHENPLIGTWKLVSIKATTATIPARGVEWFFEAIWFKL